ncbi:unnamed protein product [Protopolystoma xenopodis]|uniref:Uncharacterized protein n=1 Tax=Protopolystoma xenopodis TaxID=117903 RepID=A0A448WCW3_9PLAT|nr:unnamed protein product [Protopolystoma xenopodis]
MLVYIHTHTIACLLVAQLVSFERNLRSDFRWAHFFLGRPLLGAEARSGQTRNPEGVPNLGLYVSMEFPAICGFSFLHIMNESTLDLLRSMLLNRPPILRLASINPSTDIWLADHEYVMEGLADLSISGLLKVFGFDVVGNLLILPYGQKFR